MTLMRAVQLSWLLLFVSTASAPIVAAEAADAAAQPAVLTAKQVKALGKDEVRSARRVALRGVVTYAYEAWRRFFFVQDGSTGIYCEVFGLEELPAVGRVVEVEGWAVKGQFQPFVRVQRFRVVGSAEAKAVLTDATALWAGQHDGDYVRMSGYMAAGDTELHLGEMVGRISSPGPDLTVRVLNVADVKPDHFVGSIVEITGVCTVRLEGGQIAEVTLLVSSPDQIRVQVPGSKTDDYVPQLPLSRLVDPNDADVRTQTLVRARGAIAISGRDDFWITDGTNGLDVWAPRELRVSPGEWVEVMGYVRTYKGERSLGLTRLVGQTNGASLVPMKLQPREMWESRRYGQLIRVEGEFLHRMLDQRGDLLVMHDGERTFEVRWRDEGSNGSQRLEAGARVEITGLLRPPSVEAGLGNPRLLAAGPESLRVLTPPPWPLRRTLTVVSALAVLLAAGLVGLGVGYQRLRRSNLRVAMAEEQLRRLNAELERRIQARTRELQESNEQLVAEVDERRKAAEALRDEQEYRELLLKNSQDGIVVLTEDGKVLETNRPFADLLGRTVESVLTMHAWEWNAKFTRDEVLCWIAGMDGAGQRFVTQHRAQDGSVREVEITSNAVWWNARKFVFCVCRDMTERVRREEALRRSEERLRTVMDTITEAVWIGEPGRIAATYLSPAFERIWGRSVREMMQQPELALDSIHLDDRDAFLDAVRRQGEGEATTMEYRIRRPDGGMRWIWDRGFPVKDASGRVLAVNGIASDITERRLAEISQRSLEAQLRHAQKLEAIGTLAGGIAHDFNNILGSIVGFTELARLDSPGQPMVQESLQNVLLAAKRAKGLIGQILAFSRQEVGEPRAIQLRRVVEEAVKLIRAGIPAAIAIETDLSDATPAVRADPNQIHQVVVNLATNASHAMKVSGLLRVVLQPVEIGAVRSDPARIELEPGHYALLSVIDTGHGMDHATLERAFEPFFTTKGPGEGSGLGLSVVHGIVRAHRGVITIDSQVGEGTRVNIYLPAAPVEADEPEEEPRLIPRGRGQRILLVEDERPLADASRRALEHLGYEVKAFYCPVAALDHFRARSNEFDLVITDLSMPEFDGLRLAEDVLKLRPDLPTVLTTGFESPTTSQRARALGIRELLRKPNSLEALGSAVHRALQPRETMA